MITAQQISYSNSWNSTKNEKLRVPSCDLGLESHEKHIFNFIKNSLRIVWFLKDERIQILLCQENSKDVLFEFFLLDDFC